MVSNVLTYEDAPKVGLRRGKLGFITLCTSHFSSELYICNLCAYCTLSFCAGIKVFAVQFLTPADYFATFQLEDF